MRLTLLVFLLYISCSESKVEEKKVNFGKEESIALNQELIEEEELNIDIYLSHHASWKMTKTGTGLHYYIYKNGKGENPIPGMKVGVVMIVKLLDDKICYETPKDMVDEFIVDKSNVESGVQEAIKLMKVGDKAKLIIPSHLGHGITGNMDKIPPLSTLIVDIELISAE
jgi:FKBP-type peptidyl-prolyl cis-trans isomerase